MGLATNLERPSVLLIDDEALVRRVFARMIRTANVDAVGTAEEALERLEETTYDAILCDLSLPGLSADKFYEHLVQEGRGLHKRFAVVTGGATSSEHERFLVNSKVPVVLKPTSPDTLNGLIEDLVRSTE